MSANDRELLSVVIERLSGLPDALRQTLSDHQWSVIPLTINEYSYAAALVAGAPLVVNPLSTNLFRVQLIVATVPTGATGIVQLDDLKIPVGAGVTTIPAPGDAGMILSQGSTRGITIAGANGPASLWLSGVQLPTYGAL